jgi:MoxR-like ATPase
MSPRGTVQLLRAAQTWAATEGRDFATPGDVQTVVAAVLAHRIHVDDREAGAAEAIVLETVRRVAVPV